ncbi:TetR/AcrR family transcriptional regulator [Mucilaginibacter aquariorum]|jgi:TetR/AcrR family transcriptional repressor of multidrug resistance operon|uniref:TetR/AcrR family transcriptional regulator n=1 Tax=Mucilaginibacter aquariorum TaxID=2967225 RepID=A0ABT1T5D3_9SPHI|nr:TetR/AcrR family transcriptional regulator [Mucilaginibacter aquariorum]MCQ6959692.1 TetR/AcrR family transcriptional regulator [Mucilaginibacter aquariorum]
MRIRNTDKVQLVKQKAIELIVKHGLEGFSMNKLAKACSISVATLYIYYKDRDDLILKIAIEEGALMGDAMIKDFDPEMLFEQGLRKQWENRYNYMVANPIMTLFFEQLRSSSYQQIFLSSFLKDFKLVMGKFMDNVIARGEIDVMPFEVYWSVAFAPLYNLIRFENEGQSMAGKPFKMTDEILWKTFDLVVKALKK